MKKTLKERMLRARVDSFGKPLDTFFAYCGVLLWETPLFVVFTFFFTLIKFPPTDKAEKIPEILLIYFIFDLMFVIFREFIIRDSSRPEGRPRLLDILWNDAWLQSKSFLNIASILYLSGKSFIHACYFLACQAIVVLLASGHSHSTAYAACVLSIPFLFILELILRLSIEKAVHRYQLDEERIQFYRSHNS